jgi:Protein of unknown function (DUF1091)
LNPNLVANVTARAFNDTDDISRFTLSANVKENLLKEKMTLTMKVKTDKSKTYDKLLFRTDLEACSGARGGFATFFIPLLNDYVAKYSNVKELCPLKKGFYFIENFAIEGELPRLNFLPTPISDDIRWEATVDLKGRVAKSKALIQGLTFKIYGTAIY